MRKIMSSISYKLTVPVIIIVALIVIANVTNKRITLQDSYSTNAIKTAENISNLLKDKMDAALQKSLLASAGFTSIPSVQWAYTVYNNTNNLDSASEIISRNINPIIENSEKITNTKVKVHFHLPPAKSFLRSWTDKRGDDLTSFRNTVLKISDNHKPIKGIEVGRGGFAFRGISPIFDVNNKYVGSVEVFFPINNIVKKIITKETEAYAIYMTKEQLAIATEFGKSVSGLEQTGNEIGNFVLIQNSDNYKNDFLDSKDFVFTDNKTKYKLIDNYVFAIVPIQDFSGVNIGIATIQVDISEQVAEVRATTIKYTIVGISVIILASLILGFLINKIVSKPINQLSEKIIEISTGKLIDELETKKTDEVGVIYKAFNKLLIRLKTSTNFANEIGKGNLEININDVGKDDVLTHSLINMKNNLLEAKKTEQKRQIDEEQRNWATQGLAKFADLLRQDNDNIEKLSSSIISNLVKYLGANQGGFFLLNNLENDVKKQEDNFFKLEACYAYDRKKFIQKNIEWGDGLIGTCGLEKQTIYMTDIPENYITITSGLGDANPTSLLLVPLILNEEIFGVIEIASFKAFEKYQIEFVEKIGESIASTISSVQINNKTKFLLGQSQQQAEELAAQEEEMRQNLEEMQATQEGMSKAKEEADFVKNNLNKLPSPVISLDKEFNVTYINENGAKLAGVSINEALNSKCYNLFKNSDCNTPHCKCAMAMNSKHKEIGKTIIDANNEEILYTGMPIFDNENNVIGAIGEIINILEFKKL